NESSNSPTLVTGGQGALQFGPHNMNFNITAYTDEKGTVKYSIKTKSNSSILGKW
ncbi:hypothetical protein GQV94_07695, partial [Campylobacter sp. TTU_617]|nr:hypothetical protein [Campylobacter sp. TTU_617]